MSKHRLLLASQSPRRRELLALLGLPFDVAVADVVEDALLNERPVTTVARLSQAKAHAIYAKPGQRIAAGHDAVVGCDTVVALEGQVLGKPRDTQHATAMLRRLRGRPHIVYSAVTLIEPATGRTLTDVAETRLIMRAYTDAEIAAYVAGGDPLDKAGAYAIQHAGFHPVTKCQGCYANVMGLPLCHLTRSLRNWGIKPPRHVPTACQDHTGRSCPVYEAILGRRRTNDKWQMNK